jgi:hypothetical protein
LDSLRIRRPDLKFLLYDFLQVAVQAKLLKTLDRTLLDMRVENL